MLGIIAITELEDVDAGALFCCIEKGHENMMSHPEHFILLVEIPQAVSAPESNSS